jgi:uncharacterized protein YeaO (DUF488 family)
MCWTMLKLKCVDDPVSHTDGTRVLVERLWPRGTVTLIYSSHDEQHNNAVALKDYIRAKMRTPHASPDAVEANRPRAAR